MSALACIDRPEVLERLVDLIWLELVADVEPDTREAQVTVRQLVVFGAEEALA